MIQLHPDYLIFQKSNGEMIPCSAEHVAFEVTLEAGSKVDPEWVKQAASAVLHYFKHDLSRNYVSVEEFSVALERVIVALCYVCRPQNKLGVESADLKRIAAQADGGLELSFFRQLHEEFSRRVCNQPRMLLFQDLRACVKELLKATRWTRRCQQLSDDIVHFLRQCLETEAPHLKCGLVVC